MPTVSPPPPAPQPPAELQPSWRLSVGQLGRLAAVSPHLDDAALGCGALLALAKHASVITVFAGTPAESVPLTEWDAACGFSSGVRAMTARRQEDVKAMQLLDCAPVHLDFLDDQYGQAAGTAMHVTRSVARLLLLHHVDTVAIPLGLFHADHTLVHQACLDVRDELPELRWLAYEDALYRRHPGLLQQRLARLRQRGVAATPIEIDCVAGLPAKTAAVRAYVSQFQALNLEQLGGGDPATAERYWILDETASAS